METNEEWTVGKIWEGWIKETDDDDTIIMRRSFTDHEDAVINVFITQEGYLFTFQEEDEPVDYIAFGQPSTALAVADYMATQGRGWCGAA